MSSRDKAVHLLQHYVVLIAEKAGVKTDSDTNAELAECVDYIIDAATSRTATILSGRHESVEQARKYMNRLNAEERYRRDKNFSMLVDVLLHAALSLQYTPTELREAAMLAAVKADQLSARRYDGIERLDNT